MPASRSSPLANAALLLIDVINDMAFEESAALVKHALPAAKRLDRLRRRLAAAGVPVIYVNDNFGNWQSDFKEQVQRCAGSACPGRPIASLLVPEKNDYFVLKPKHSGFHCTSLEVLLAHLGVTTLILGEFAADICVLYTANDAYMRDYSLVIPRDCVASETEEERREALQHMKKRLGARVCLSSAIR
ncbi:cysteine hydrolase [Luteolibacter ambystomatis]|uniref:Cysteine hydrolase n=1 Tax=Luteolibacter ambystomatis TaxID=2824561 RepID=A0A975PGY6_9BACT|nr:isochorismatase family cysteine hydrolase [Luteolibacter ambystomatis]QUE53214.1 cysteine hydrolase [Luteolibacter ambystomatis]